MLITEVDIDDRGNACFQFDNDEWVAVTQYRWATEEQRRLIEDEPVFEGWIDEDEDYTEDEDEDAAVITKVDIDDIGIMCFLFDNDEWVPVTCYRVATEEQRRLIEEHPEFEGWIDDEDTEAIKAARASAEAAAAPAA